MKEVVFTILIKMTLLKQGLHLLNSYYISTLSVIICGLLVYYVRRCFTYWSRNGVYQLAPIFPMGNCTRAFTLAQSIGENLSDLYNSTTERMFGIYLSFKPALVLRDPVLINQVLIKDFQHFRDRGPGTNLEVDPLSGHLFVLTGDKWKNLRSKLSPAFTSGKLKMMFQTLVDCGITLDKYINNYAKNNQVIEIKDVMARYATDITASVAFGIDVDSINNPDVIFHKTAKKVFATNIKNGFRNAIILFSPKFLEYFKIKFFDKDVEDFMLKIVKETIDFRETNNVQRNDLMQLLIQLKDPGNVDMGKKLENEMNGRALNMNEITAQALVFYLAAYETSSSTMSFCLYELAKNIEIQNRVRQEIRESMEKYDNRITYESIMEVKYLDSCIDETLRKYPPLPILNRVCTKPIQLNGTKYTIKENELLIIPLLGIQRDPKYFPDPMKFNPDRFYLKENNINPLAYLPFGDGPRNCIGLRMGKMMIKVGLSVMLSKYKYELGPNTKTELEFHTKNIFLAPVGGFKLKITHI